MKILSPQAIVVGLEKINLADFPDLKVLGVNCTGLDHLNWDEINKRNIKVISLKDYPEFLSTIFSTAEHTIGLIIALLRNYKTALNYPYKDREFYKGHTLAGKTLGIIGFGRIGKQLLKIATSFGMDVWGYDKRTKKDDVDYTDLTIKSGEQIFIAHDIQYILNCDIVSIHIPLDGNLGFFTRAMFQQMKPSSYFINTSRLGVVQDGALLFALENEIIARAAVDFIEDPDLLEYSKTHDNLILTNHQSGNTFEDREKTENFILQKVEQYLMENKI